MINFIKNLFGFGLRSKVMKAVNLKINEAQKALDSELKGLEEVKFAILLRAKDTYREEVSNAKFGYKVGVENTTEKHINNILSKIL